MKILISILLLFSTFNLGSFKLINEINITSNFFTTDNLGNVYTVNNKQLTKFNKEGNKICEYSNNFLGDITSVDVSNPLRILIFYKDFNQIVFLDNTLSAIGSPINLNDIDIDEATLVCGSNQNGFIVLNSQTKKLCKYDKNLKEVYESFNLGQIVGREFLANEMFEKNGYVYLNIPNKGILIFDMYGVYVKTIYIRNLKTFQIKNKNILYHNNNSLNLYNLKSFQTDSLKLPDFVRIINSRIEEDRLYILKANKLLIYQIINE
ncbi:MAG: hypothetical protein DRJ01_03795 [Bacteroidetes bacterium]|nr:MAG: hypothetical protein DRJ01_03795 [Bacteroidota bacterium]